MSAYDRGKRLPQAPFVQKAIVSVMDLVLRVAKKIGTPPCLRGVDDKFVAWAYWDLAVAINFAILANRTSVQKTIWLEKRSVFSKLSKSVADAFARLDAAGSALALAIRDEEVARQFVKLGYSQSECDADPDFVGLWKKLNPRWPSLIYVTAPQALESSATAAIPVASRNHQRAYEALREKIEKALLNEKSHIRREKYVEILRKAFALRRDLMRLAPDEMKARSDFAHSLRSPEDRSWMLRFWNLAATIAISPEGKKPTWGMTYWWELYAFRSTHGAEEVLQDELQLPRKRNNLAGAYSAWVERHGVYWGIDAATFEYNVFYEVAKQQDRRVDRAFSKLAGERGPRSFLRFLKNKRQIRRIRAAWLDGNDRSIPDQKPGSGHTRPLARKSRRTV